MRQRGDLHKYETSLMVICKRLDGKYEVVKSRDLDRGTKIPENLVDVYREFYEDELYLFEEKRLPVPKTSEEDIKSFKEFIKEMEKKEG